MIKGLLYLSQQQRKITKVYILRRESPAAYASSSYRGSYNCLFSGFVKQSAAISAAGIYILDLDQTLLCKLPHAVIIHVDVLDLACISRFATSFNDPWLSPHMRVL